MDNRPKRPQDKRPLTTASGRTQHALRLLFILTVGVILAESRHLLDIPLFNLWTDQLGSIFHIAVTTLLVFPVIYLFAYRPLLRQIARRAQAEEALKHAHEETEQRVVERTAELTAANQTLENEILERRRVEQLLQLQTAALESAVNGIVIVDRQGTIEWCNPAYTRMTGYDFQEAVGKNFLAHQADQTLPSIHHDLWKNLLEGKAWQGEIVSRRKDGTSYVEEQTITPVIDKDGQVSHFVAIKNDISERKQAEKALETERQRLFSLLNQLPAIVYLKAPDFTIRYANDQFRSRIGDPEGQLCYRLIHKKEAPCEFCPGFQGTEGQDPLAWEYTLPDGRVYQLYDYPFLDTDGQALMLQLGIDITERKQAEIQLEQRNMQLQSMSLAEHQQRQLAESLVQATLALNTSLEMNLVLDAILEQIQKVIPCSAAGVLLLEDGTATMRRHRGAESSPGLRILEQGVPIEHLPQMYRVCSQRQVRIINAQELEPEWEQLPGLDWIRSALMAPLDMDDRVLGAIVLVSRQDGFFRPENQTQLQAFTPHAVQAIQNARLFDEVLTGRERLQALSRRLVEIQEKERRRIALELHDEAGQALTSIKVQLHLLDQLACDPQAVRSQAQELNQITDSVMETLHQLAVDLRPASLEHIGLVPSLEQYLQGFGETHRLDIQLESLGIEERLPLEMETALYRIVQESLTNIARHAQASRVAVLVQKNPGKIVLTIEDDGQGFNPQTVVSSDHLGLVGMQERLEMLKGHLAIESQLGQGTIIYVEVPYAG